MVQKLQIALIFKLVSDASFANAKTISVSIDTDLKLMIKMVDRSNARP